MLRQIWVRSALIGLLGVITALAGIYLARFIPTRLGEALGSDAVAPILTILASSMLAVVTFSLSVAVQAFSSAADAATPRASRLLAEDPTTQNVLSIFVGAFLFSLVGIIALSANAYGAEGRVALFFATLVIIVLVVVALLQWINHIMHFGRIGDTLERVESAATKAICHRAENPFLGGQEATHRPPLMAIPVTADKIGYVQHIDIGALSDCADTHDLTLWIEDVPGSFVSPATPLFHVVGTLGVEAEAIIGRLRGAFTIADNRNFDQDPRFGLIVLSEIASRALSPAVNDPGTAIDVIGRLVRILAQWTPERREPEHPRIFVPAICDADLIEDAFQPIVRDSASIVEVQVRLQKALAALGRLLPDAFGKPAGAMAEEAAARARQAFVSDADRARLDAAIRSL